jgi:hypothetical protein
MTRRSLIQPELRLPGAVHDQRANDPRACQRAVEGGSEPAAGAGKLGVPLQRLPDARAVNRVRRIIVWQARVPMDDGTLIAEAIQM